MRLSLEDRLLAVERRVEALERRRNGKETKLTPYGDAWQHRFGTNSEPPWKELAQQVPKAEQKLGHETALERWSNFLAAATESKYARPVRWVQGLGEWKTKPLRW